MDGGVAAADGAAAAGADLLNRALISSPWAWALISWCRSCGSMIHALPLEKPLLCFDCAALAWFLLNNTREQFS